MSAFVGKMEFYVIKMRGATIKIMNQGIDRQTRLLVENCKNSETICRAVMKLTSIALQTMESVEQRMYRNMSAVSLTY